MSDPLISVILPMYNNAGSIRAAVHSILRQTVSDIEVIIVDDGSSDDSYAMARGIRDARIRLYRNELNLGVSKTRNRGIELMRGSFMAPMDADDICTPRRLELTLDVLQQNPAIGVCGGWALWKGWGPVAFVGRLPWGAPAVAAYLLYGMPAPHPTLLFRGELLKRHAIRYSEDLRAAVDYDFYLSCARHAGVDNVPAVLMHYVCNPQGITHTRGQEATARRLRGLREYLERLFPAGIDDATLRLHARIGNGTGATDTDELERYQLWLEGLERANQTSQSFDGEGLALATAMVWFRVCRNSAHLGLAARRAWFHSPWAQAYHPTVLERASSVASWALSRVMPSRRKPQGGLTGL